MRIKLFGYIIIFFTIIFCDRVTKYWIYLGQANHHITQWLTLTLQYNRGIALGLLHSEDDILFMCITVINSLFVALFMYYTITKMRNNCFVIGEIMTCAGALSNLVDKFWYKGVLDFILVSYGDFSWPVFNIADIFIVLGLALMTIAGFFYESD